MHWIFQLYFDLFRHEIYIVNITQYKKNNHETNSELHLFTIYRKIILLMMQFSIRSENKNMCR